MTDKEKQKLFDYTAELGRIYDDLVCSLRLCVELLSTFKPLMPDPDSWQELLDMLNKKVKLGERVNQGHAIH